MKRFLLATMAAVALGAATPASAADLGGRPYAPAALIAPVYDWSGLYVGANAGWGSSRSCWTADFFGSEGCHRATGLTLGGQVGYRWQVSSWVFGLEAQGNWADLKGSNDSLLFGGFANRSRVNAFGLLTAQVGYAVNNALFYVKGGAAVTNNRFDVHTSSTGAPPNVLVADTGGQTRWGAAVGLGVEYGFAPNWSVAVEYDHLFMQARTSTFNTAGTLFPPGVFFGRDRISQDVDIVTLRLNYRFASR
ncbi:MAG: porin family protein [Rhizobiales bacterium]|nr:porin family protein [Hyphomicrobiales bacterium]